MNALINALGLTFSQQGLKYAVAGDNQEAIVIMQKMKEAPVTLKILFVVAEDNKSMSIKFYNLYHVERVTEKLILKVNELNKIYRWVKLTIEDKDVVMSMDHMVNETNIGRLAIELALIGVQMGDLMYKEIDAMYEKK
ncbi:hypothetical protein ACTNBM_07950 [Lachnospiraceae bacterium HCP1S3_C3]|nr:YbjN domain-containing protein [Lachnospiraceae bacterium]MDD6858253.1 hypothetical protein [Lachnospiraceae bacterium]